MNEDEIRISLSRSMLFVITIYYIVMINSSGRGGRMNKELRLLSQSSTVITVTTVTVAIDLQLNLIYFVVVFSTQILFPPFSCLIDSDTCLFIGSEG